MMSSGEESNREEELAIVNLENVKRISETYKPNKGKGKNKKGKIPKSVVQEIWKDRLSPRFYSRLMSVMFPEDSNEVSFLSFYTIYKNLAEPETEVMFRALTIYHIATIHEPPFNYEQANEYPNASYKAIKDYICDVITSYLHAIIHINMKEAHSWLDLRASNTLIDGNLVASYMLKDLETHRNEVSIGSLEIWLEKNEMYYTVSEQLYLFLFGVISHANVKPLIPLPVVQTGRATKTLLALPDVLLLNSKLPKRAQRWTLAYMLDSRSQNWETFKQAICGRGQTIIVIQDANGDIFGMYGSHKWFPSEGFFGNDECFLFTLKPDVNIYEGSGRDNNFQLFTESGIGMGGSESDPGIFINWSLRLGTTASKCITFNKFWPISRDLVFDIRILELWVVSEVLMKKRHVSKRDFYSTVVMWNRIGRHKAKDENKRADRRDYCFRHEINPLSNYNHCSQIHETDERHFEPSHASLTGENNIDDELLIAIKNRLAGVPPMPGALSLKPEAKLQPINRELPLTSNKPQYLGNIQSSKLKKVPTQVSTQVDDNMITELKNQATATSQVKVTSRYTQSGIGMALQTEETAPLRHSSRMQRADEGNRLSLPLEQNTRSYKITNGTLQTDERYQKPLQPRRNSFPNHIKQTLPSSTEVSPQANNVDSPLEHSANRNSMRSANQYSLPDPSIHSDSQSLRLPEVPEFYRMSSQRPSVTRSVRSNLDEASYNQQMNELSWTNRNNTGAILPYQQQLVHAAAHRGDGSGEVNQEHSRYQDHQPPTRREINSHKGQSQYLGNNHSSNRSLRDDCDKGSNIREESTKRPSPCRFRDDPASADHRDIQLPEEQTVLRVTTQQMERCQMCRCGSKELNLVCSCKKSALKESAVTRVYEGFRECKCPRNRNSEEDESRNKKKKKDKRGKADKEAKAEEKRRKKEEKECKKRERARQKAKEKEERKKNKCKEGKKSKNKGDKECKMCLCCKCCSDGGETTIVQSDTCLKKSKKEKKSKEKKPKGKKKGNSDECPDEPPRSCDCPQELQTDCNDGYKLPPQPTHVQISQKQVQGQQYTTDEYSYQCCNHPDVPCPALVNRELNQSRIQNSKSVLVPANSTNYCGDPVCTNTKQIKTFRSCCCCAKTSGGCEVNVCSYVANVEQPVVYRASTNMQGNSPSARVRTSPSPPRMSSFRSTGVDGDSMRYGDITAAPALILPIGVGHGDAVDVLPGMPTTDTRSTSLPTGCSSLGNVLIDSSRKGRENGTNKRYVPPCVLYLDCTKVKDLCVIIKDKYEEPS